MVELVLNELNLQILKFSHQIILKIKRPKHVTPPSVSAWYKVKSALVSFFIKLMSFLMSSF